MSVKVKTCPIMEAIARKLFGIEQCPLSERRRMIARAVKAGKDTAEQLYGGFEMMEKYRENEKLKFENAELKKQADSLLALLEYSIFVDKCRNAPNLTQAKADEIVREWENKRRITLEAAKGAKE